MTCAPPVDGNCSPGSLGEACVSACILHRSLAVGLVIGFVIVRRIGKRRNSFPYQGTATGSSSRCEPGWSGQESLFVDSVNPSPGYR
jgi:hypothetical protein